MLLKCRQYNEKSSVVIHTASFWERQYQWRSEANGSPSTKFTPLAQASGYTTGHALMRVWSTVNNRSRVHVHLLIACRALS